GAGDAGAGAASSSSPNRFPRRPAHPGDAGLDRRAVVAAYGAGVPRSGRGGTRRDAPLERGQRVDARRARHRGRSPGPRGRARGAAEYERGRRQRPGVARRRVGSALVAGVGDKRHRRRCGNVGPVAHGPSRAPGVRRAGREPVARLSRQGRAADGGRCRFLRGLVHAIRPRSAGRSARRSPRGMALRCGAARATRSGLEARATRRRRRWLAGRAGAAAPGVREHGLRATTGDAPEHPLGSPAARVGGRTGGEEPAGPTARLRVRGAARGARRERPVGRARPRGLRPSSAHHARAVRAHGDVPSRHRYADVSEMTSPTIKRVLVANRGEIALRIIRACHEEGLEAVAVYSEADRLSPHVRAADLAVPIGPPAAVESYLDVGRLIAAAQSTACQAVHPGYGFLSERAPFAEAVAAASLEFVGPPAAAIRAMGDKTEARRRMQQAGVPIVPGTTRPLADHVQARPEAARLGYPVLLKASAGGGGKGMRLVREEAELEAGFEAAASEALKAFGAGEVYLEKYLERPRHIE